MTYIPEERDQSHWAVQILRELWFTLLYMLLYLPGLLIKLPHRTEGQLRPVVIVPGFLGQTLPFWRLRSAFIKAGHPVYVVPLGFQVGNIYKKGKQLESFLEKNKIDDCYMIGHSMGGLIALAMSYRGRDRVRKLYLVNTPLKGTLTALAVPFTIAGLQMLPFSPVIRSMSQKFNTFSNLQTVFAKFDQAIVPRQNLRMGRFDDVMFAEIGHLNLGMGSAGIECLRELVRMEENKDPLVKAKKASTIQEKSAVAITKVVKTGINRKAAGTQKAKGRRPTVGLKRK